MMGFISVNRGIVSGILSEDNRSDVNGRLKKIQTVGRNKKGFRKGQHKRESASRKLNHMVGVPTLQNLKMTIRQYIIQN